VTVICSAAKYVRGLRREVRERAAGVNLIRLQSSALGKGRMLSRIIDYASFFLLAAWRVIRLPRQDVVISLTTPPFIAFIGLLHKLMYPRVRLILWSMDCYPEVLELTGFLKPSGTLDHFFRDSNRLLFRSLDHLVCLDGAMRRLLMQRYGSAHGTPPSTVIPNWERLSLFPESSTKGVAGGDYAEQSGGSTFDVLYLGNAGIGHRFDTVLQAAQQLRDEQVRFLFVGGGSAWRDIAAAKEENGLHNVILQDYIPKSQTASLMSACNAALITLRDEALGLISPSKLHSTLAVGLPVVYVGPEGSNVDEAIRRYHCGISIRNGDVKSLCEAINRLRTDADYSRLLSRNARNAFEVAYSDAAVLPMFDQLLASCHGTAPDVLDTRATRLKEWCMQMNRPELAPSAGIAQMMRRVNQNRTSVEC
jgi:glycosyltransferase involved in cell wall biosynthesis